MTHTYTRNIRIALDWLVYGRTVDAGATVAHRYEPDLVRKAVSVLLRCRYNVNLLQRDSNSTIYRILIIAFAEVPQLGRINEDDEAVSSVLSYPRSLHTDPNRISGQVGVCQQRRAEPKVGLARAEPQGGCNRDCPSKTCFNQQQLMFAWQISGTDIESFMQTMVKSNEHRLSVACTPHP